MYKNYVFDLYGTLADIQTNENKSYLWKKMSEIYSALGASYTAAELRKNYKKLVQELIKELPENGEPDLRKVFVQLFEQKGITCDRQLAKSIAVTFRSISRQRLSVYEGVKDALQELRNRGKGIYLLSNAQSDFTRPELDMLGLTTYFDGILISSEAGYKKPSKEFYQKLFETFQIDSKDSLMVGNDESADIAGAKKVGMDSLYIHTSVSPELDGESTATYVVMDGDWKKVAKILFS